MITLKGYVSKIDSAHQHPDGVPRINIDPQPGSGGLWALVYLPNTLGLQMDQEVEIIVQPQPLAQAEPQPVAASEIGPDYALAEEIVDKAVPAPRLGRPCPRCGVGWDDDGDGNCGLCARLSDMEAAGMLASGKELHRRVENMIGPVLEREG